MNVKIYMSDDNKALIYDNDQLSEFNSLVSELGLICDNQKDKEKSPIPYMWLDASTIRAFKILCPAVDQIEKYRLEIPLEILRNVKLSTTESYFDWIEVWSNAKDPDPFCVGRVFKSETDRINRYTWAAESYLIGRWGAEDRTITGLIEDALKIASGRISAAASTTIAKMTGWKTCPDDWARQYIFNGNSETSQAIQGSNEFLF